MLSFAREAMQPQSRRQDLLVLNLDGVVKQAATLIRIDWAQGP